MITVTFILQGIMQAFKKNNTTTICVDLRRFLKHTVG